MPPRKQQKKKDDNDKEASPQKTKQPAPRKPRDARPATNRFGANAFSSTGTAAQLKEEAPLAKKPVPKKATARQIERQRQQYMEEHPETPAEAKKRQAALDEEEKKGAEAQAPPRS